MDGPPEDEPLFHTVMAGKYCTKVLLAPAYAVGRFAWASQAYTLSSHLILKIPVIRDALEIHVQCAHVKIVW